MAAQGARARVRMEGRRVVKRAGGRASGLADGRWGGRWGGPPQAALARARTHGAGVPGCTGPCEHAPRFSLIAIGRGQGAVGQGPRAILVRAMGRGPHRGSHPLRYLSWT